MSADLNKLKNILAKSKAVMKKTDAELGSPMGSNNQTSISQPQQQMVYEEKEMPNLTEDFIQRTAGGGNTQKSVAPKNGHYPNAEKSKMPKAILEAMINNPIEIPENPFGAGSFSLDDVPELVEPPKQQVRESLPTKPQTTSLDRDSIREIVREEFEDMVRDILDEYMEKSLVTEDIHIKIGDTIFGGSLKPLPKKKRKTRR